MYTKRDSFIEARCSFFFALRKRKSLCGLMMVVVGFFDIASQIHLN